MNDNCLERFQLILMEVVTINSFSSARSVVSSKNSKVIQVKWLIKFYRDIYFIGNIPKFTGKNILYYSGKLVKNAGNLKNYKKDFDRSKDYYFSCNCLANTFSAIVKVSK